MSESKPQLLFLDDDLTFLEMLENIFTIWSEGRCEIHIAENAGKALGIIQRNNIDLVAVDLLMPVLDGVQFIGLLNRKYPNLLKVALSGSPDKSKRDACIAAGAELFLEKPSDIESMRSIFSTMEGLALAHKSANPAPKEGDYAHSDGDMADGGGFRGMMRVGLSDIVQMECLARNSSILQVKAKAGTGKVFIEDGKIIHAEIGTGNGVDAFNSIMALKGGEFKILPFQTPGANSIEGSWEFLLMEAARLADEQSEAEISASQGLKETLDPAGSSAETEIGDSNPFAVEAPAPKSAPSEGKNSSGFGSIPPPGSGIPAPGTIPPPGGMGSMDFDIPGLPSAFVGPGAGKKSKENASDPSQDFPSNVPEASPELIPESVADPIPTPIENESVGSPGIESELGEATPHSSVDPVGKLEGLNTFSFKSTSATLPRKRGRRQNTSTPLPSNIKKIAAPNIAELLITNESGKALREWQTLGVEKRSNFLELVKSKSHQMTVGLPLGNFDRLIVESKSERVLCKIKSDWKVFVRVQKQQASLE